ncbi:hypothetical protein XA68_17224 [Ophiocordyceps unilateralis]|uniref:Uncharacterized protein n=1 Tax=Ophiocordyceps unilateralis TaxID=268505 RepID=A0A2A9P4A2_OPHUN|nr:hypothetical protein XA68_17224 [Ophiocordyceps unilateralis]
MGQSNSRMNQKAGHQRPKPAKPKAPCKTIVMDLSRRPESVYKDLAGSVRHLSQKQPDYGAADQASDWVYTWASVNKHAQLKQMAGDMRQLSLDTMLQEKMMGRGSSAHQRLVAWLRAEAENVFSGRPCRLDRMPTVDGWRR